MSSNNDVPTTPDGWKQYSESYSLPTLPQKSKTVPGTNEYILRDIYVDAPTAISSSTGRFTTIHADVIAFPSPNVSFTFPKYGIIQITCRVVTATEPVVLALNPTTEDQAAFIIYGSTFDQAVSYKYGSNDPVKIDLSPASGNLGAQIVLENGVATLTFLKEYVDLSITDAEFGKSLATQLRIASILFWLNPAIALALTSYVAVVTASSKAGALLNLQAHALGKQISASALTGPDMNYAPVLTLDTYQAVLNGAIATTAAFETQYNRFADRQATIEDQKLAWKAMLDQANDAVNLQKTLVDNALARWDSATDILNSAEATLQTHQFELDQAKVAFAGGLEEWKEKQIIETIFNLFQAVIEFVMAIGEIVLGDPEAAVEAPVEAEEAVKAIAAATGVENAFIKAETVDALKDGTEAIYKLFQSTSSTVIDIRSQMDLPPSDINLDPAGGDVSGNGSNDADLEAIVNLAAWDDWTLQTDEQLAFAVAQNIGGAATYQLELRRHAIDGKLLTQARAQAVKLGQEFSRSWLQLHAMQLNATRLQELLDTYEGEEEAAEEAQSDFYDRLLMLRTSIMIYMRDAVWAYKFYTMSDSSIVLDPLKTTNEYQLDSQLILQEVTACKEQYASDFTPFKPTIESIDLPLDYPTSVVKSLQSTSSVTITLAPATPNSELHNAQGLLPPVPGPFTGGSRFRVFGMRAFLLGAQPLSFDRDNKALVQLRISTSGVYADVQDGKVYGFTIKPLDRPLEYLVSADGTADPPIKDSIVQSEVYVDPTAFAQWTVKLVNPQDFDLKDLTGLKLYWEGKARFD